MDHLSSSLDPGANFHLYQVGSGEGQRKRRDIYPFSHLPHDRQGSGVSSPMFTFLGPLICAHVDEVNSTVLPRACSPDCCSQCGTKQILPQAAASEGQGQLSEDLPSWSLVVAGSTDMNIHHGCGRAIDTGKALDNSPVLDITMA